MRRADALADPSMRRRASPRTAAAPCCCSRPVVSEGGANAGDWPPAGRRTQAGAGCGRGRTGDGRAVPRAGPSRAPARAHTPSRARLPAFGRTVDASASRADRPLSESSSSRRISAIRAAIRSMSCSSSVIAFAEQRCGRRHGQAQTGHDRLGGGKDQDLYLDPRVISTPAAAWARRSFAARTSMRRAEYRGSVASVSSGHRCRRAAVVTTERRAGTCWRYSDFVSVREFTSAQVVARDAGLIRDGLRAGSSSHPVVAC